MWHCIEERTDTLEKYGRIQRKILFNEVYSDRESLVAQKTKQIKIGDCVAFCEANGSDIHEGRLVCSSVNSKLDAKEILGKLLTSEDDIRLFCEANQIAGKDSHLFSAFHRPVQYVTEDCYPEDPLDNVPLSVHLMENCATVDDSNEISDTVEPLFTSESANNVSNHDVVNGTRTISMKRKQPTPTAVKQCKQLLLNKIGRLEVPNNRIVTDTTEDSSPRPPSPQNHDLDVSIIKQEELDVIELESSGSYDQDHGANDDDGTNGDFYTGSFENQLFETLSDYFELSPQHLRLTQSKTQTTSAHLNAMINENPSTSSSNGLENDQMNRMIRPVITPVIEMFHDCTFCTHRFKDADILRIHVRAVHLTCDICGAILNSSSELLQHKETVHDRIKYYFCGKCSFSSYSTESLHLHMRVHSNQRTFNCSKCATTFSRKHLLNKHIVNTISCQPDQPSK